MKAVDLELMKLIDKLHLKWFFYGARKLVVVLARVGRKVGRARVTRLMRLIDIEAIDRYGKPEIFNLEAEIMTIHSITTLEFKEIVEKATITGFVFYKIQELFV